MTTITNRSSEDRPENNTDYFDARRQLRLSGWRMLGEGALGSAWEHPDCPDTVLKVARLRSTPENDGWLSFIATNQKTRSPHAPRVLAVEIFEDFYYAEIERLEPISYSEFNTLALGPMIFDEMPPTLRAFMRRCERLRRRTDFQQDMHGENAMRRPATGEIVITDPWY